MKTLAKADPVLKGIMDRVGLIKWPAAQDPFPALVRSIFYQQLAGNAAAAIMSRFLGLYNNTTFPSPSAILQTSDGLLHSVGLSRQKVSYLKDLATKFVDKTLIANDLKTLSDDEITALLMSVRGVGRWTVDMFLIFTLHRLDIFPSTDLGIRKAIQVAYDLDQLPKPNDLMAMSNRWRPYRTVATLYFWRTVDIRTK